MKNDIKIKSLVEELNRQTSNWLNEVKSLGNQCAYTDRMLEDITKTANIIKKLHEERFNK